MADQEATAQFRTALAAWRRSAPGFPLDLAPENQEDRETGTRRFSYSAPEHEWKVSGWAHVRGQRPTIRSLTISHASGEEVTAGLARSVPVGKISASLRTAVVLEALTFLARGEEAPVSTEELFRYSMDPLWQFLEAVEEPEAAADDAEDAPKHTGGRAPLDDDFLRGIAESYLMETAPGMPKKPVERMAEKLGRPQETVRTWIARARQAGWLGPGTRGRTGAEPGPRLLAEYARMPFAESTGETTVTIVAPPPEGSESPEEARERALRIWRRKVERGEGGPRPNSVNIEMQIPGPPADEPRDQ